MLRTRWVAQKTSELQEAHLDFESRLARLMHRLKRPKGAREIIFPITRSHAELPLTHPRKMRPCFLMAFREACGNHIEEWLCEQTINMPKYQCYCTWRKHCSAIEKLQGLKMPALGSSSEAAICFSGFPRSVCREAKQRHTINCARTHDHI